ncbi:pyridine nucleotide-disulfide oxidoreductase [Methanobrevibacter sp. 87.7]|uniref:FAD-dependent oxidoreductase n=1 Tax=Methanobrevibacter sp. 87.7 TaxID=387957 RepID=UPI000B504F15|nr:NAD(P)/FAD-dependent oxidoreductase [Methanobrevibacter sp. 87.7]OWT33124.1 pyridine nucleotide-disulfide oxidoreductase [Methanobrevibacter sp. 87.7]
MENIVIGSGPAGRVGSIELGKLGEDVILIEKKHIAGTCLNEGCMVICALNDVSRLLNNKKKYENHGFIKGNIELDYKKLTEKIIETQEKLRAIEQKENESVGNKVIFGEAKVEGDTVTVNGESFNYKNLMVATGGRPSIPQIEGVENGYYSNDILNLKEVPEKLNIIGGGIISAEIANIFSSFGSEVNIFVRSSFLKELNQKTKDYVIKNLLNRVNIYENTDTLEINKNSINTSKGEFEGITFICTGRVPNSEIVKDIVKLNPDNSIATDNMMKTNVDNIYAAGDVTGGYNLTPVARMEGITAARNMAGLSQIVKYNNIPQSITLDMPVSFINNNKNSENNSSIGIPGLAGPETFWNILNGHTGFTEIGFDKNTKEVKEVYSISPSSLSDVAYMSLLMNIGEDMENFDEFIEVHPNTDAVSKIMKYMY